MKEKNEINESRRDLLKGIATAAVAGAVVAGTTQVASASEVTPVRKTGEEKGISRNSAYPRLLRNSVGAIVNETN